MDFTQFRLIWGGMTPQGGVPSTDRGSKNGDISTHFRRRRRREKFLSTFFEIFGKFVNKNAIKSDFWGVVCRYISKISKKIPDFGQKVFLHRAKFRKYFSTGALTPPNLSGIYRKCTFLGGGAPQGRGRHYGSHGRNAIRKIRNSFRRR